MRGREDDACVVSPLDALNTRERVPWDAIADHWARAPRLPAPAPGQPRLQPRATAAAGVRRQPVDAAAIAEGDILLIADPAGAYYATMRTEIAFGFGVEPLEQPRVLRKPRRSAIADHWQRADPPADVSGAQLAIDAQRRS